MEIKGKMDFFNIFFLVSLTIGILLGITATADIISPRGNGVIISMISIVFIFVGVALHKGFDQGIHSAAVFLIGLCLGIIIADYVMRDLFSFAFRTLAPIYSYNQ